MPRGRKEPHGVGLGPVVSVQLGVGGDHGGDVVDVLEHAHGELVVPLHGGRVEANYSGQSMALARPQPGPVQGLLVGGGGHRGTRQKKVDYFIIFKHKNLEKKLSLRYLIMFKTKFNVDR